MQRKASRRERKLKKDRDLNAPTIYPSILYLIAFQKMFESKMKGAKYGNHK
jgi:hypothetical protein